MKARGEWSWMIFISTLWVLQARKAFLYFPSSMLRRISARTRARGYIVSRLPRGICSITAEADGIAVTSRAPRSMLLHLSSVSGESGGTSRSGRKLSMIVVGIASHALTLS